MGFPLMFPVGIEHLPDLFSISQDVFQHDSFCLSFTVTDVLENSFQKPVKILKTIYLRVPLFLSVCEYDLSGQKQQHWAQVADP